MRRANVDLASVEVRFKNLSVSAEVAVGARGEPTVLNAYRNKFEVLLSSPLAALQRLTNRPCCTCMRYS